MLAGKSVSLCMVVYNPMSTIKNTLESVKHIVDEIVITNQGSDESQISELREYLDSLNIPYLIYTTTNKGNADYDRQFTYALATKDYVLALDADETVPQETIDTIAYYISKQEFHVMWFLFSNLVSYQGKTVDLRDMLKDDPHPRFWINGADQSGKKVPVIVWPHQAHTMPQIPTPMQIFTQVKFLHHRSLENIIKTHLRRGRNIDPRGQHMEKEFLRGLLSKFEFTDKKKIKSEFPELAEYLKG